GRRQCRGRLDGSGVPTRCHRAPPGVECVLRQAGATELLGQVRAGDLDAASVSVPMTAPAGVSLRPLSAEPLLVACAPGHRLAGEGSVRLTDLKEERFVDFHEGWITRDLTDRVLAAEGLERRVTLEVHDVHLLLDLVAGGL